jgi:hypothetical protein
MDGYMTKLRRLVPALMLALVPAATLADDYRLEVRGNFDRDQPAGEVFDDVDILSVSGTWYFKPVSTDGVPLAEAAFLGRASSVSAIVARFDSFFGEHLNVQAANVGFYFPESIFFASAGFSRGQQVTAVNSTITQKEYFTTWFGSLGVAPLDGLLISTRFQEHGYDPNITARHVGKLPNGRFYAGSVSIVDPDQGDTSFGLDFDYFFDESTSLGTGYEDGGDRWELRAEKFFSGNWAAGVSAYTADGMDGFGVHLTWRN